MVLTYPSQGAILRFLPFRQRQLLGRCAPRARASEAVEPYRFEQVSVRQTSSGLGSCRVRLDHWLDVLFFGVRRNGVTVTGVTFWDWSTPDSVVVVGKKCTRWVPRGLTVEATARQWVEYVLGRTGTRIGTLTLTKSPTSMLNCTALRVDRLILRTDPPPPIPASSWLPGLLHHPPRLVDIDQMHMLDDETVKAATSVVVNTSSLLCLNDDFRRLLGLKALELKVNGPIRNLRTFCTTIAKYGRPVGFRCCSEFSGSLEWLAETLEARRTQLRGGVESLTIDTWIDDDVEEELNLYMNPNSDDSEDVQQQLIVEVSRKGSAVRRSEITPRALV